MTDTTETKEVVDPKDIWSTEERINGWLGYLGSMWLFWPNIDGIGGFLICVFIVAPVCGGLVVKIRRLLKLV